MHNLQTREDWLEWRRGGIGSSDASAIMGVSPWRTAYQVWEEKVLGTSQNDNAKMQRGRELEETARREFEKQMNVSVFPKNCMNDKLSWLRASLDGIDVEGKVMVEIKCPNKDDHFVALNNMIPSKYIPQVQHQLAVTGLDGMYYYSFDGTAGTIVEVARDQSYIEKMMEEEYAFWQKVLANEPPELSERDYKDMEKDHAWMMAAIEYSSRTHVLKELESQCEGLKETLKELAGMRAARGHGVSICPYKSKGSVDYSKIPQLAGVDLEKYRKAPFTKWRISAT